MVNFNGELIAADAKVIEVNNRGLQYGDSLFEAIRVVKGQIIFLEEHYLRLMAGMRILRMEIPMRFTAEFMASEILMTTSTLDSAEAYRVRFTVFRNSGGLYTPCTNEVSYTIEASALESPYYSLSESSYEVELFKDFYVNRDMLSNLKTNNRILNVLGSIYAKENDYDNCILLNVDKQVVEALNGNLFLVKGNVIKTPPLKDGCLDGIIRKKVLQLLSKLEEFEVLEESISPFELQKADELFITNVIKGIVPVTRYRKKVFVSVLAAQCIKKLNVLAVMDGQENSI